MSEGVKLISVRDTSPKKIDGKLEFSFYVDVCVQCEDYPCAEVCAFQAISVRPDGIVVMDEETCTGCELCIDACPFDVISYDAQRDITRKCNMCHRRVDQNLVPACADNVCLAHCIYFGDPEDIKRRIAHVHAARSH